MGKLKITSSVMVFAVFTVFVLSGCSKTDKDTQTDKQKTEQNQNTQKQTKQIDTTKLVKDGKYVCPMHPLMQSNEPMKCPVCRMDMELKSDINKQMSEEHENMESKFSGKKDAVHFEVNLSPVKSSECQTVIESALQKDPGIMGYHTDIFNKVVHLYFDKSKTTKANIEKLISDAGYDANGIKANPDAVNKLPADCK